MRRNCPTSAPASGRDRCRRHRSRARPDRFRAPMRKRPHAEPPHHRAGRFSAGDDHPAHAALPPARRRCARRHPRPAHRPASRPRRDCSSATFSGGAEAAITIGLSPILSAAQASAASLQRRRIGRFQRIEFEHRHVVRAHSQAAPASRGSMIRQPPRRRPPARGRAAGSSRTRQHAGAAEILRQTHRHARSAGDQRVALGGLADREQMGVGDGVDDGVAAALFLQRASSRRGSPCAP